MLLEGTTISGYGEAGRREDVRVTTVTVGNEFEEKRSFLLFDGPSAGVLDGLFGGDDVHSIYLGRYDALNGDSDKIR